MHPLAQPSDGAPGQGLLLKAESAETHLGGPVPRALHRRHGRDRIGTLMHGQGQLVHVQVPLVKPVPVSRLPTGGRRRPQANKQRVQSDSVETRNPQEPGSQEFSRHGSGHDGQCRRTNILRL
jgi:hypothetical protein